MSSIDELRIRLTGTSHPLIAIQTLEEGRLLSSVVHLADSLSNGNFDVITQDASGRVVQEEGATGYFDHLFAKAAKSNLNGKIGLSQIVDEATRVNDRAELAYTGKLIYVIKDASLLKGADAAAVGNRRVIKHCVNQIVRAAADVCLILVDYDMPTHPVLEEDLIGITWPLPDEDEIAGAFRSVIEESLEESEVEALDQALRSGGDEHEAYIWTSLDDLCQGMARAAKGLKLNEAEHAFKHAIYVADGSIMRVSPLSIVASKKDLISRSGVLEFYDASKDLDSVGGLDLLKAWLGRRKEAFSPRAKAFGLPTPKAILLVGPPGTGKSATAKTIGAEWRMPVIKLDMGALMNKMLGQSESNLREALRVAEAVAPAILWVDGIEKSLPGTGGNTDGGTSNRMLGSLLTWMNDRTSEVFVVATANDPSKLPTEFTRKGRFDGTFWVGFPNKHEREEIFAVHLRKKGRDPEDYDLERLAAASDNFTGAEIEACINEAMFQAFDDGDDEVSTEHIAAACAATRPMKIAWADKLAKLEEWGSENAEPASSVSSEEKKATARVPRRNKGIQRVPSARTVRPRVRG